MILEALADKIVMKMLPKKTQKGSIRLSDGAAEESDFAVVVAVGPYASLLMVGDTVLRPAPAEWEYVSEEGDDVGTHYLICPESSVPARVPNGGQTEQA